MNLRSDLVNRLCREADKEKVSLDRYVESVLMDIVYDKPNKETLEAVKEAKSRKSAGTLEMDSFEAFMKSVNGIE